MLIAYQALGVGLDLHATIAKHLLDSTRRPNFMRNLEMERSLVEGGGSWEVTLAHIETMIFRGENVRRVVRMLCLASLTYGGIPKKNYDPLKREMFHGYGPQVLLLLIHLETAGLLQRKENTPKGGFAVGTGRYCSPRHWIPFNSRNDEGSECDE